MYNVSRCIVDIDVHKRCEEYCSRSRVDDRKRAAFARSSMITVAYLSPCFFHRDSSSREIRCEVRIVVLTRLIPMRPRMKTMKNNSSRELRKRSVLSVVESLSHRNVHTLCFLVLSSNRLNSLMLF
ncbi:hypothetical protein AVEN_64294-1 [Araneus ventricosus]|uniref:Uncharacterized protein n=1 Tax=Araneus ventricosus TaxID=182803 RepID=A0A4Y2NFI4_ARAVE|nr:hypothetical protein AVEN_64294-1 [Araneus ventricosus]